MAASEVTTARQPELILASDADRRVGTSHSQRDKTVSSAVNRDGASPSVNGGGGEQGSGRHWTSSNTTGLVKTPDNTPRHPGISDDSERIATLMERQPSAGGYKPETVLDEDEMFMALTDEEKQEWEAMMKERSHQFDLAKGQHRQWVDSFTRRRMFVYSRMRKLQQSYTKRVQFFTQMSDSLTNFSQAKVLPSTLRHAGAEDKRSLGQSARNNSSSQPKTATTNDSKSNQNQEIEKLSEESQPELNEASPERITEESHVRPAAEGRLVQTSSNVNEGQSKTNSTGHTSTMPFKSADGPIVNRDILSRENGKTPLVTVEQVGFV